MLMIVVWHSLVHGFFRSHYDMLVELPYTDLVLANYALCRLLIHITAVAVNCYVLITGYFMINTNFKWMKLVKLWVQVLFYSVGIYLICVACRTEEFSWKYTLCSLIPVRGHEYWFITMYFALIALAPFLSLLANALTKRAYAILLLILFIINIDINGLFYGEIYSNGYSLWWFLFLFLTAGFIRKYGVGTKYKQCYGKFFGAFCIFTCLLYFLKAIFELHYLGIFS